MNEKPSSDDIVAALTRSGYLMEQEVATQLEALGCHVQTNRAFEDSEEGKSREIDVHAIKRVAHDETKKLSAFIEIIAECKSSTNPFVFIERPKNREDNAYNVLEYTFPIQNYQMRQYFGKNQMRTRERGGFSHLGFDKIHYAFKKETKAVQFCRIDRKGSKWHANHGGLYDAIFYPMAKAVIARKSELPKNHEYDEWKYFWILIPIIVINGEIFSVDSNEINPVPKPVNYITFKRELRSQKLNGVFALDFVRQEWLESFSSECLAPIIGHTIDLITHRSDFVLQRDLPWEE